MPTDTGPLLRLENLSARIGRQVILDAVCLEVEQGECVALVGGSGAGKSALLRCVIGLSRPARPFGGRMQFADGQVDFASDRLRHRPDGIAYVPQNPDHGFDPLKKLRWQWRQAARIVLGSGDTNPHRAKLLEAMGLSDFGSRYPHEWSRGMQQRLLLAMALLGKPRLLILDEPTSALDPLIAAQVLRLVMEHSKENGIALLIVTHDLSLATRYANRTAIMTEGRIVEFGSTRHLLATPQSDYGRLLVANRSWSKAAVSTDLKSVAAE